MKLSQFAMVERHVVERNHLLRLLAALDRPSGFHLTADSIRLDEGAHALVKPVVAGELRARLRQLDADMAKLGVTIDWPIPAPSSVGHVRV